MFAAVLDTCVLWPSLQRDFLLSLAAEGAYAPQWSSEILAELEYHEARKLEGRGASAEDAARAARRLITQMGSFDDALVEGWEGLEGEFGLPDPDDEHVVAAAVVSGAEVIVTENLKDFPESHLPANLRAAPAHEFVEDTVRQHLTAASRAVLELSARSGRHGPSYTPEAVLGELSSRYGMSRSAELLRIAPALRERLDIPVDRD